MIALMIEPGQMQNAMQHQDFHFLGQRVAHDLRVLPGNVGGDGKVTH